MAITPTYNKALAVTKSDTVDLYPFLANGRLTDAVSVNAGIAVLVLQNNDTVTITVPAGDLRILPMAVRRVNSTTTTATEIVALYQV